MELIPTLSKEFNIRQEHAANIVSLIDSGNTIPFIARYRKEMTGSCDDQVLRELFRRMEYIRNLEKRRTEIRDSIAGQGKLTEELVRALDSARTLAELEDHYRPYRPKRRTRAAIACEKGLEPLSDILLAQDAVTGSLEALARPFVSIVKEVPDWQAALAGARDIIAERISDDPPSRGQLRERMFREASLVSRMVKEDPAYSLYADYNERAAAIPAHRILAINRGEREGILKVGFDFSDDAAHRLLRERFVTPGRVTAEEVERAALDAWARLMRPSIEREVRAELTEKAQQQAIALFALNLRPLLLQPPVRGKTVMGVDPAFRTGCKIAVVDPTGKVLGTDVMYPTAPQSRIGESKAMLLRMVDSFGVDVIAIGNGTASRETEQFVAECLREMKRPVRYAVVNEAGASVYSASQLAAGEFPDLDVTLRSAVSIARRLQDPLAELVKIDPKSIGVGQYQHDMPPPQLDAALTGVVEDCVNSVGVDINTASAPLLCHVSGLGEAAARSIVAFRDGNGPFRTRAQLRKVPRMGARTFEQSAGFLRIPGGDEILDGTSVHPESYGAALRLLKMAGLSRSDVVEKRVADLPSRIREYGEERAAVACGIGLPTLRDIVDALVRPGRDPRDDQAPVALRSDVLEISGLKPGMALEGTVRNVVDFGIFVDIGVHQDGLVHVSEISDRYIRHPSQAARVGDVVNVWVLSADPERKRVALTMKDPSKRLRQ